MPVVIIFKPKQFNIETHIFPSTWSFPFIFFTLRPLFYSILLEIFKLMKLMSI